MSKTRAFIIVNWLVELALFAGCHVFTPYPGMLEYNCYGVIYIYILNTAASPLPRVCQTTFVVLEPLYRAVERVRSFIFHANGIVSSYHKEDVNHIP